MKIKLIGSVYICLIFIVSCASVSTEREFNTETSTFTSNNPPLEVLLKCPQAEYGGKQSKGGQGYQNESHFFKTADGLIIIDLMKFSGRSSKVVDYYHLSIETMLKETDIKVIDSVSINDEKWFRVYLFAEYNWLYTGYFKQSGHYIVGIMKLSNVGGKVTDISVLQGLSEPTPELLDLLEDEFALADTLYKIVD